MTRGTMDRFVLSVAVCITMSVAPLAAQEKTPPKQGATPQLVAHRGLFKHAPENTLAAFGACLDLKLGFELDIRRSKDGVLVCVHDADVKRTTNGQAKVADLTLAELRKLDAGGWFDPIYTGERVPTLEEVFALAKLRGVVLIALDFKIEDDTVEAEVVGLAKKHGLLNNVVCIGRAITEPGVRKKLRAADPKTPVAVLAQTAKDLDAALADVLADWIYVRFVPTSAEAKRIHAAGKRIFLSGPLVAGFEPANWRQGAAAPVDALLTDYPLECRWSLKGAAVKQASP